MSLFSYKVPCHSINFPWFIINEGVHYSPLDGSDIQIKTSKNRIQSKLHNQLKKKWKKIRILAMKGTFEDLSPIVTCNPHI
ncbi:hypothetical protein AAG906_015219 [Vitis piasezkii]